ncbi:FG-GAP repeat domain-containing protein [Streptomyces sp. NBC_00623]|uniref:FG-GAP repeat domain-containing protein n=1 Tax=Streptomyces sp. NBC_00623 TaxID=2975790 RepID=UPI00386B01FC
MARGCAPRVPLSTDRAEGRNRCGWGQEYWPSWCSSRSAPRPDALTETASPQACPTRSPPGPPSHRTPSTSTGTSYGTPSKGTPTPRTNARQAGTVTVTHGSPSRKADKGSGSAKPQQRTLREGHDGLPEQAEPNDRFGAGLLTGDLDGDGCTDLVVNAPGESWDGQLDAGRSMILWGSRHGLSGATPVDRGSAAAYNALAFMAIGDFNADGHPDLVVTTPDSREVLYGQRGGLSRLKP